MERIGAFAMTEPTHGSDASSLQTRARKDSKHYVLDGCKRWITNGSIAELRLTGVKAPLDNRLERARSFADTSRVLVRSRQGVAWEGLGHAMAAYDAAVAHTLGRQQFGRPLAASHCTVITGLSAFNQ